jgi:hypothetical protein
MKRLLLLIAACVGVTLAWLRAYEATPTQASWSGKVGGNAGYGVGERICANFDSITEVSLFCGTRGDTSHHYWLDVYDAQTNDLIAYKHNVAPPGDHRVMWNCRDSAGAVVAHGLYLVRLETPGFADTKKIVVTR